MNWYAGWTLMLSAFISGAVLGLFFHRDDFLGGYASFRRRILRLGHIALAALGMINVLYSLSPLAAETGAASANRVGGLRDRRRDDARGLLPQRLARRVPLPLLHSGQRPGDRRRSDSSGRFAMKIGFLAMSGLRAHDPKLLELGMTLPGILERGKVLSSLPSLGLLYLAACTPPGHELHYYEAERDGAEPPDVYTCDLVAISTFSAQVFEAYAVADRLRKAGVKVAMGGLHVTVQRDEALEHADFVFLGEGERSWPAAVAAIAEGHAPRVWDAARFPPLDIRALPIPRYDLLGPRPYARFPVQTTRGCPWRCDFCASNVMLNEPYRKRPVADVIRDIHAIRHLHRRPFIEFADDNTFVDHAWGKELCRQLIPLGVKWFTETDISVADDVELLQLMRQARCRQVLIGLESPERSALEGVELRANFKSRRAAGYIDAVRRIQAHGITVNGCFILGLDRQGPNIFEQVLEFVTAIPLYDVQLTVLTPFPGTPLHTRLLHEGRILQPGRWDLCTLFDVNYVPTNMTVEELRHGLYWLAEKLYSEEGMMARRRPFFDRLWQDQEARSHTPV